jgi:putative membrane protein
MIERFTDHSANERTYLAWIRTAIAIAGFGFLIEKLPNTPDNTWTGLLLVGLSAALVLFASLRFLVIRKQIAAERLGRTYFGRIEVLFTVTLALLLLTVFVFLLGLVRAG